MASGPLHELFMRFCSFGDKSNSGQMDGVKFAKFSKETNLIDKNYTKIDVDLIFAKSKAKSERKIDFEGFKNALKMIAEKKFGVADFDKIVQLVLSSGGPVSTGTVAESVKFHDDKELYTGSAKNGGPTTVDKDKVTMEALLIVLRPIFAEDINKRKFKTR